MTIRLDAVSKTFGDFAAVDALDLEIATGELVALLGPSGSGKTTLLRMIAGLDFPDSGRILFDGEDATARAAADRRVGFVFQHYALFRHMTVLKNVDFGLRVMPRSARPTKAERHERVMRLLRLVQLEWTADRYPAQLSGGQRQRVALARALAIEPRVLLLDEPFGALDATVRKELRRWLRRLHDEIHVTSVFVTHDQEEALEVADRVVVMNHGRIEQVGTPAELHDAPQSPFVYQFLGHANQFAARIEGERVAIGGLTIERAAAGLGRDSPAAHGEAAVFIRPHEMLLLPPGSPDTIVDLDIRHVIARGGIVRIELGDDDPARAYEAEMPRDAFAATGWAPGTRVAVGASGMRAFPG